MGTKKNICNIVIDEKFIDETIECIDLYSDKWDTTWIICSHRVQDFQYIRKNTDRVNKIDEKDIIDYIKTNNFDAVILHSLQVVSPATILGIPKHVKLFWFSWGYDIYNFPINKPFLKWNLYKPLTAKFKKTSIDIQLYELKLKVKYTLKRYGKLYIEVLNRIDYFSGLPFEFDLLKQIPEFRAQWVFFTYSSLSLFKTFENYNGNNILVGNNAALTNNHLDCLEYLKRLNIGDRRIILPLSYGKTSNYVDVVEESYRKIFGDKVDILADFIPYDEYSKHIQSCSIAVFFMNRQQAMGNIKTALKTGCKVFLSKDNPLFSYLKDSGIYIFSVEQDLNDQSVDTPLTEVEIKHNRDMLISLFGYDACLQHLDTIYNALL